MTVHTLCKLMLAAMVPALALPGLVATRSARPLTSALLLLQVRGHCAHNLVFVCVSPRHPTLLRSCM